MVTTMKSVRNAFKSVRKTPLAINLMRKNAVHSRTCVCVSPGKNMHRVELFGSMVQLLKPTNPVTKRHDIVLSVIDLILTRMNYE